MTVNSARAVVTLPTDTQILITREFDAPVHLVYRAWTTPELIRRWWAGQRGEMTIAEVDLRVGGAWRYVMEANGGFEVAFHGEFREIVPDERIVHSQVYEPYPDVVAEVTNTFTADGARTIMTVLVQHPGTESRDDHINSGMEGGMNESFDLLEEVARRLG